MNLAAGMAAPLLLVSARCSVLGQLQCVYMHVCMISLCVCVLVMVCSRALKVCEVSLLKVTTSVVGLLTILNTDTENINH